MTFAAQQVRQFDRERFVTALFAPPERRDGLMALYAFNVEVAKVRESVREAMAGLIRLQWWRDVIAAAAEGRMPPAHPIAIPLAELVHRHHLPIEAFDALLTAREQDLSGSGPADAAAAEAYADHTSGGLTRLALMVLGVTDEATLAAGRHVGIAWALVGQMRALGLHLSQGRLALPASDLAAAGTDAEAVLAGTAPRAAIAVAVKAMGERAAEHLVQARRQRVGKDALAALLPATLASAHLAVLAKAGWDPFNPLVAAARPRPLRLAWAHVRGRF
jgi:phytoene synthase